MTKVIIFGPTGNVGAHAAISAQQHGAEVILAMRDTSKSLTFSGNYERVQADLLKTDTVTAAVKKTGAKRAFIYYAHGAQDGMKASLEALKAGGIEYVVFLSSYDVTDAATTTHDDPIAFIHAQVELNLEAIFGNQWTAVRGGSFAVNVLPWYGSGIKSGEVKILGPQTALDMVTPDDLGGVAGSILATTSKENVVYVLGPQYLTQIQVLDIIKKHLGKDFKVAETKKDVIIKQFESEGMPGFVANYLGNLLEQYAKGEKTIPHPKWNEAKENVIKYTGKPGLSFDDWVEQNKESFT